MRLPQLPSKGQPISTQWARQVYDYLRAISPRSSATVRVSTTSGGTTFEARRSGGGSTSTPPPHHYQVEMKQEEEVTYLRVHEISHLFRSIRRQKLPIVGLGAWFPVVDMTDVFYVWLEITLGDDGINPESARIEHGSEGWESYPEPGDYTDTTPRKQTHSYRVIAVLRRRPDETLWIDQEIYNPLIITMECDGRPLVTVAPYG